MCLNKCSALLLTLLVVSFISKGHANYEFNQVGSKIITSSFAAKRYYDDCVDFSGRSVKHGFHFVPPKQNMCPMCICENGHPKNCRTIACAPPHGCKLFSVGLSCCEYICLDDIEAERARRSNRTTIIVCFILLVILIIICLLVYRFKKRLKEEFDKIIEKRRVVDRNPPKSETVSSELTFTEEPPRKSVYMISQNEVIDELKKRIGSMELKLDPDEIVQNGCSDHKQNGHAEPRTNGYCDSPVELKDSSD